MVHNATCISAANSPTCNTLNKLHAKKGSKMKTQYMIYCSYPYSEDPERTTKEINAICKEIYNLAHARDNDLLLMIPHNIFDAVFDKPAGYNWTQKDACVSRTFNANFWMPMCELTLITRCDAFAYEPTRISPGVLWEKTYAELIQKPIYTYAELKAGKRPDGTSTLCGTRLGLQLRRRVSEPTGTALGFAVGNLAEMIEEADVEKGKKFDSGKPMIDLIVPEFIVGVAKILTMGAQKYGLENWKNNLEYRRIYAAMQRHALAYHTGEHYDKESGLNHMLHVACNAMFIFWYEEVYAKAQADKQRLTEEA
jgi:hypothetical protein